MRPLSSSCARCCQRTIASASSYPHRQPIATATAHQKRFLTKPPPTNTLYSFFPETLPLGPPPAGQFPINTRRLRSEFLRLQAKNHPDKHPAQTKPQAEAVSASINEAFRTLANPLLRAQYLLSLQGVDVAGDETLKIQEPELLATVLEAHETIEDADSVDDLEVLTAENDARIETSEGALGDAFRRHDVAAAKKEAVRLRYWVNIRQAVHDWEQGRPTLLQH